MHMNFFTAVPLFFPFYDNLYIPWLADIFIFLIYASIFEIVHTCVSIQNNNAHKVFSWQPQILYIFKPYLFLHIYDLFSIPCLAVMFVLFNFTYFILFYFFCKGLCSFTAIHRHFTLKLHTCVYVQNTSAHKAFSWQPQIFFISMPYFFLHTYGPLIIPSFVVIVTHNHSRPPHPQKSGYHPKSVLSRHYIFQEWKLPKITDFKTTTPQGERKMCKISPSKTTTSIWIENWQKAVLSGPPNPSKVEIVII